MLNSGTAFRTFHVCRAAYTEAGDETTMMRQTSRIDLKGELGSMGGFRIYRCGAHEGVLFKPLLPPQGEVYATTVNTKPPMVLSIPLAGLPSENYFIFFSGEAGMVWEGLRYNT